MLYRQSGRRVLSRLRSVVMMISVMMLAGTSLVPLLIGSASAVTAQLEPRQASVTTAKPGDPFDLTVSFDVPSTDIVLGAKLQFCDNALSTCGNGGGGDVVNTPTIPSSSTVSQANWTDSGSFGSYARGTGDDGTYTGAVNNMITVTRTASGTGSETAIGSACDTVPVDTSQCRQLTFTGLTNNATPNDAYYIRLRLYSVSSSFNDATNQVFYGTMAQSTSQTLTVNARVQEHLDFCVGTTTVDDTTSDISPTNHTCEDIDTAAQSTVDVGTITSSQTNISPVANAVYGGNGVNGVAMVASNAANGTIISYFAQDDGSCTSTPAGHCHGLKVSAANCNATIIGSSPDLTDKCFNDATTPVAFGTGVEGFGMAIGGVNNADVQGVYSGANLVPDNNYFFNGSGGTAAGGCTGGTGNGTPDCVKFTWEDDGTTVTLATSESSSVKVINYEALVLKFAARAAATTPTGQYTVQSTYIATSTF